MKLTLVAVDEPLFQAWHDFFIDLDEVEIYGGDILDLDVDAVVSPANSYGFMDGGIDAYYTHHFGQGLQLEVRRKILEEFDGELLVGQALDVATGDNRIPYLIAAPTMRVPMKLGETVNPYLAARAVFNLVKNYQPTKKISKVAMPGLGTGVGGISPNTCAKQVLQAYKDTILEEYTLPKSWAEASERHQLLYTNHPKPIQ